MPVAGLLYFGVFEHELLDAQEKAMVQQARLLVAFLEDREPLTADEADSIFRRLQLRTNARLRVLDREGKVLADSSRSADGIAPPVEKPAPQPAEPRDSLTYRIGFTLFRLYNRLIAGSSSSEIESRPDVYPSSPSGLDPEVRQALAGKYGAAWRLSPGQRSITLYSAVPLRSQGRVVGAVLVSQSTLGVLRGLYQVRVSVFRVVLISVVVAIVLSLILAGTIARPLHDLGRQASALLDSRGQIKGGFRVLNRRDEIGDLSRSLDQLAGRLRERISFADSFAADVAHEFRNPLASIRSATEMAAEAEDPAVQERFHSVVASEVARMERLLTDLREIARIDSAPEEEFDRVDLNQLIGHVVQAFCLRGPDGARIDFTATTNPVLVWGCGDNLARCLENVIDNAIGFSPAEGRVAIALTTSPGEATVTVRDHGPGIPEEHLDRIFSRFFTYRPGCAAAKSHTGLGLAIAEAIVRNHGGRIEATNHPAGGAVMRIALPMT
jgi:two-component system sensor histidine kinase ChvG